MASKDTHACSREGEKERRKNIIILPSMKLQATPPVATSSPPSLRLSHARFFFPFAVSSGEASLGSDFVCFFPFASFAAGCYTHTHSFQRYKRLRASLPRLSLGTKSTSPCLVSSCERVLFCSAAFVNSKYSQLHCYLTQNKSLADFDLLLAFRLSLGGCSLSLFL